VSTVPERLHQYVSELQSGNRLMWSAHSERMVGYSSINRGLHPMEE
jgi:hypothetical protein